MSKIEEKVTIRVKVDAGVKARAENILKQLGFTPTQAIDIFYRQIEHHREIPMNISLPHVPVDERVIQPMCHRIWK